MSKLLIQEKPYINHRNQNIVAIRIERSTAKAAKLKLNVALFAEKEKERRKKHSRIATTKPSR